jgi:glycosyltransferase involved in cell wall biosynthesis
VALYRMADFCIVSSLHDGMNLVAKEFIAARDDEDGVLVLSEMTGAAHELEEALIINPYDIDGFSRALERAIADAGRGAALADARAAARRRRARRVHLGVRHPSRAREPDRGAAPGPRRDREAQLHHAIPRLGDVRG